MVLDIKKMLSKEAPTQLYDLEDSFIQIFDVGFNGFTHGLIMSKNMRKGFQ